MKKFSKSPIISLLLAGALMLSACSVTTTGGEAASTTDDATSASTSTATSEATDEGTGLAEVQELTYNMGNDVNAVDPRSATGFDQRMVIFQVYDPLFKYDAAGNIVPGAAESYELSEDGLTLTIKIREHNYSDGTAVTANDFVFAMQTAINPEFASDSATDLTVILNADAILAGEMTAEELGVTAIDDYTLEIKLAYADPFILHVLSDNNFCPIPSHVEGIEEKDLYTLDPATFIGNGPFKMVEWLPQEKMVFEKNENYWNAENVTLEKLTYVFVPDANTAYAAYNNGDINVLSSVPAEELPALVESGEVSITPWAATEYYALNQNGLNTIEDAAVIEALANKQVRQALSLAIDRVALVETVQQGGQVPATGMVPHGVIMPDGTDFRSEKDYFAAEGDVAQAQELLAEAGYPNGEGFPEIEIYYNTTDGNKKNAEAIQEMWRENLGINVVLTNKETAVFADERASGLAEIARCGNTCATYAPDILDLFHTEDLAVSNEAKWSNADYDAILDAAEAATDLDEKFDFYRQAEDMLMDEMVVIPLYYYVRTMLTSEGVEGLIREGSGLIRFEEAYIVA